MTVVDAQLLTRGQQDGTHSLVLVGFFAAPLKDQRDRVVDVQMSLTVTVDEGPRGKKAISMQKFVEETIESLNFLRTSSIEGPKFQ